MKVLYRCTARQLHLRPGSVPVVRERRDAQPVELSIQKIVVLFDGFAGRGADADLERAIGIFLGVLAQLPLNLNSATNSARCRDERCHDAIASVLDLASA